jgi:ribosomal protein L6P/L9E
MKRLLATALVLTSWSESLSAEEAKPPRNYSKQDLKTDLTAAGKQSKEAAFSACRAIRKGTRNAVKGVKKGFQHAGEGDSRNAAQKKARPARQ